MNERPQDEDYHLAVVGVVEYKGCVLVGKKVKKHHHMSEHGHIGGVSWGVKSVRVNDRKLRSFERFARKLESMSGLRYIVQRIDEEANCGVLWYQCVPLTHELSAGDDLVEVKYVPISELEICCSDLAVSLWPDSVREWFDGKNT